MCSEYSKKLNEMRLKVLSAKQEGLADILSHAHEDLAAVSKKSNYGDILKGLICQAR